MKVLFEIFCLFFYKDNCFTFIAGNQDAGNQDDDT